MPVKLKQGRIYCNKFASVYICMKWSRSTMDSMRVSEAPDPGSIPGETTYYYKTANHFYY